MPIITTSGEDIDAKERPAAEPIHEGAKERAAKVEHKLVIAAADGEVRIAMGDYAKAWLTPEQAFNLAIDIVDMAKIAKKQRTESAPPLADAGPQE